MNQIVNKFVNILNNIFYTYVLLDPRKPGVYEYGEYKFDYEPFYVGKGKECRIKIHLVESQLKKNSYKNNKIKKILSENFELISIKYQENLLECQSFNLEINMIKTIGRVDLGTGPLTNCTDGGEGTSNPSEETRTKMINSKKDKFISYETKVKLHNINIGKKLSDETKKRLSRSHKGKKLSELHKQNISKVNSKENHPFYGKHHSEETKEILSKLNLGKKLSPESIRKRTETRKRNYELKNQIKQLEEII